MLEERGLSAEAEPLVEDRALPKGKDGTGFWWDHVTSKLQCAMMVTVYVRNWLCFRRKVCLGEARS